MLDTNCKNVLVSQPPLQEMGLPFLPVMWGIIKTYWEHYGSEKKQINWLQPINQVAEVETLLRPYQNHSIDVLIISCYIWNWHLQCLIAEEVKKLHPNCLVIAGGPEPDYKDINFFNKYPYIDVLSSKDAEISITKIIDKVLKVGETKIILDNNSLLTDISGLYLPSPNGESRIYTGPAVVPTEFEHSFYLEQSSYFKIIKISKPKSRTF